MSLLLVTKKLIYFEALNQWRNKQEYLNACIFFLIVIGVFPLVVSPEKEVLQKVAPGIIWVAILFSQILSLQQLFREDYDNGSIDNLFFGHIAATQHIIAKMLVHWCFSGLPLIILAPVLGLLFSLNTASLVAVAVSTLLGTLIISALGVIIVSLTLGLKQQTILIPILLIPIALPMMIFGGSAIAFANENIMPLTQYAFLTALVLVSLVFSPLVTSAIIKLRVFE